MKKQYTNFMMQSATNFDQQKVKEAVKAKVQEETPVSVTTTEESTNQLEETPAPTIEEKPVIPAVAPKVTKPRLRQQAYYLTEDEIKTIKRLSYELDIPKSDLVRKFIDEGISKIDQK